MGDPDFFSDTFFAQAALCWPTKSRGSILGVRDQGRTNSCYAFAVVSTMFAEQFINGNVACQGSVQELIDCLHIYRPPKCLKEKGPIDEDKVPSTGYPNSLKNAFEYVRDKGIAFEEQYPFVVKFQKSNERPKLDHDSKVFVKNFKKIDDNDHNLIVNQLSLQPVAAGIRFANSFRYWNCAEIYQYLPEESALIEAANRDKSTPPLGLHALTIVGFGDEGGVPYYLCQNSFGSSWGYKGYVKVARGTIECVTFPVGTYTSKKKRKIEIMPDQSSMEVAGEISVEKKRKIESMDDNPAQL